jgi:hypothetical protein
LFQGYYCFTLNPALLESSHLAAPHTATRPPDLTEAVYKKAL